MECDRDKDSRLREQSAVLLLAHGDVQSESLMMHNGESVPMPLYYVEKQG